LREVEAPTFSRQSAHRWRQGCQPYAPAAFYPPGRFLILFSVRGSIDPMAIVRLEGLGQLKKFTSSGSRTGNLPACSIVPQPTILPRAPGDYGANNLNTLSKTQCSFEQTSFQLMKQRITCCMFMILKLPADQ
jgi:hypothetical protein